MVIVLEVNGDDLNESVDNLSFFASVVAQLEADVRGGMDGWTYGGTKEERAKDRDRQIRTERQMQSNIGRQRQRETARDSEREGARARARQTDTEID